MSLLDTNRPARLFLDVESTGLKSRATAGLFLDEILSADPDPAIALETARYHGQVQIMQLAMQGFGNRFARFQPTLFDPVRGTRVPTLLSRFATQHGVYQKSLAATDSEEQLLGSFFTHLEGLPKVTLAGWNLAYDLSLIETASSRYPSLEGYRGYFSRRVAAGTLDVDSAEQRLFRLANRFGRSRPGFAARYMRFGRNAPLHIPGVFPGGAYDPGSSSELLRYVPGWKVENVAWSMRLKAPALHDAAGDVEIESRITDRLSQIEDMLAAGDDPGQAFRRTLDMSETAFFSRLYRQNRVRGAIVGPEAAGAVVPEARGIGKTLAGSLLEAARHLPAGPTAAVVAASTAAIVAYRIAAGKRRDRQTQIEGLAHGGMAGELRRANTSFGSGLRFNTAIDLLLDGMLGSIGNDQSGFLDAATNASFVYGLGSLATTQFYHRVLHRQPPRFIHLGTTAMAVEAGLYAVGGALGYTSLYKNQEWLTLGRQLVKPWLSTAKFAMRLGGDANLAASLTRARAFEARFPRLTGSLLSAVAVGHIPFLPETIAASLLVPGLLADRFGRTPGQKDAIRAAGFGSLAYLGYRVNTRLMSRLPAYAGAIRTTAESFERYSPAQLGGVFRLSELASIRSSPSLLELPAEVLAPHGTLGESGRYLARLGLDEQAIARGLHFERPAGDVYHALVGDPSVRLLFAKRGSFTSSAAIYNQPLRPEAIHFRGTERGLLAGGREALRDITRNQTPARIFGRAAPEYLPLWRASRPGWRNQLGRAVEIFQKTGLELSESPLRLLAHVGAGLPRGSYNKFISAGRGGVINELVIRRVLPAYAGITALRWADYHLHHLPSNAVAATVARLNLARAGLTDAIPGGREVTDFYARTVPGPQYGPLALPVSGALAGAMVHYFKLVTKSYGSALTQAARHRKLWGVLRFEHLMHPSAALARLREGGLLEGLGHAGSGMLAGALLALPFIPGMLGSRKTRGELASEYSGETPVPVRSGRWWDMGNTPLSGGKIKYFRPSWYVRRRANPEIVNAYGSEREYWRHDPLIHPLRYLRDPYYVERNTLQDRPYPVTSPAFANVPLIGPLLAATIGKVIKPPVYMHGYLPSTDYIPFTKDLEPDYSLGGIPPQMPAREYGIRDTTRKMFGTFMDFFGLRGFVARSGLQAASGETPYGGQPLVQGSRNITSWSRRYYDLELGALFGPGPAGDLYGYTEPLRRFIQPEQKRIQVNQLPNRMPSWLPGEDYYLNFHAGDPYAAIAEGSLRLPGKAYETLHPEVRGIEPERYPLYNRFEILGDVAPYSREFRKTAEEFRGTARGNEEAMAAYEAVMDRVEEVKRSGLQYENRQFSGPVAEISGTVESASAGGIRLREHPNQVFYFSGLGTSALDLTSAALGDSNRYVAGQARRQASERKHEQDEYLSRALARGARITLHVPGGYENSTRVGAVVETDGHNINQELLDLGLARFRRDRLGPESRYLHGILGRGFGRFAEAVSFTGDQSPLNPLRYVPTPGHTKLLQARTALGQYYSQQLYGRPTRIWSQPVHDMLAPWLHGTLARLGIRRVPSEVARERDVTTEFDYLAYIRAMSNASRSGGRSRAQWLAAARRTAIGSDLFGAPEQVLATLPKTERDYFRAFLGVSDAGERRKILDAVSPQTRDALAAQWLRQRAEVSGMSLESIERGGRFRTPELEKEYRDSGSRLAYADWTRAREIASFFTSRRHRLPAEGSLVYDPRLDLEDVELKVIDEEGLDYHDFKIYDDRAEVLWRKPAADSAVREMKTGISDVSEMQSMLSQIIRKTYDPSADVKVQAVPARQGSVDTRISTYVGGS